MTSNLLQDLVRFSWHLLGWRSDQLQLTRFLLIISHATWQDSNIHGAGAMDLLFCFNVNSYKEGWQETMNLHWAPVNSAHEDFQRVVKAKVVCMPCICDQNVCGTPFAQRRLTVLVKCANTAIKGRFSSLKMLGSEQGSFDAAAGNHSQLLPGKGPPSLERKPYEHSTTVLKKML